MTGQIIQTRDVFRYSVLALPVAFAGFPLYVLAPDFYATRHGLSLTLLGVILLALRIFDAVQDPLIGVLSDRYRHMRGGFMIVSAVSLCLAIYGLFNQMYFSTALWFALCMGIAVSCYSILSINLNTVGALWTENQKAQTRIAAWRESFGLVGLLMAVTLPGALASIVPDKEVFLWFSILLAGSTMVSFAFFLPWLRRQDETIPSNGRNAFSWKLALRASAAQKRLFFLYAVSVLASSIPAVLVLFFVRDLLDAEHLTGLFLVIYFLSGALGMPLWKHLSDRYGKERAWLISMMLAIGSFVWAFFLTEGDVWQYGMICFFSGIALGADLALPPSLLADRLHATGSTRHAAMHYSILALITKASLAVASVIVLPLLDSVGFQPDQTNSPGPLLALSMAYAIAPCALKCIAAACLYFTSTQHHSGEYDAKISANHPTGSSYHV